MQSCCHARPHDFITVKKEQGRCGIEQRQQEHNRQIAPSYGKRLTLGNHHQAQSHCRHKKTVKQDRIRLHAFTHQRQCKERYQTKRNRRTYAVNKALKLRTHIDYYFNACKNTKLH